MQLTLPPKKKNKDPKTLKLMRERGRKQGWGGGNSAEEKKGKHIFENLKAQERGQRKKVGICAKNESND